jgi:nucleoside-diphosphate-sugar epimerase
VSRFLVTGATGFIGSAIVRRLRADGHEIVAPDSRELNLLTATDDELAELVDRSGASRCIHCAWYTNHADYLVHDLNREWAAASLRLAHACRDIRFVGLGTCLEHEAPPATLYAQCKRELFEVLTGDFAWARVFFVYGPGDRAGRLIPGMLDRFARGEPAGPTYGGLRRDYIHVDDLAGQIVRIARSDLQGAIEVGTGEAPTLSEIFAAGAAAFGRPELAEANDETGDQPRLIQADMSRFQAFIGDPGARSINQGLRDLVG